MPTLWFQLGELEDWRGYDEPELRHAAIAKNEAGEDIWDRIQSDYNSFMDNTSYREDE